MSILRWVNVVSAKIAETYREVKIKLHGDKDVRTADEAMPYGWDSSPVKDMVAILAPTQNNGQPVIIGYINKNQLAEVGETRMYSTDADGALQTYVWLKNDGTMEVGGDADNMVRYSKLETAFNELKGKVNSLVTAYNAHTHILALSAGTGTAATTATTATASTADITQAKIDEIKTL